MDINIAPVTCADVALLHQALTRLSVDLGDTHIASLSALEAAGFGASPSWRALLAQAAGTPVGALLASPLFSTTRGGLGLFVSDLWVDAGQRGQGLGQRLLACALREWSPVFVKLAVYDGNDAAHAFYARAGFVAQDDTNMILHGAALDRLKGLR
ncbi:GNAT family N-acetyltransferase [Pseudorhodobacter sp.]|jgi:GNAT superfamily N-acetyltransferase|uniref:GNAT family N-acetyltransferase n=1 Tax=Pseudorhodobacter sp. TaxID=1934400 RepID=UPI002AFE127E|nr:GNAT family N-acetyltransferase [Pseudorhodobacter sp.]